METPTTEKISKNKEAKKLCQRRNGSSWRCQTVSGDNKLQFCDRHYNLCIEFYTKNPSLMTQKKRELIEFDNPALAKKKEEIEKEKEKELPPDEQRCRLHNGLGWRCKNVRMSVGAGVGINVPDDKRFCKQHYFGYYLGQEEKRIGVGEGSGCSTGRGRKRRKTVVPEDDQYGGETGIQPLTIYETGTQPLSVDATGIQPATSDASDPIIANIGTKKRKVAERADRSGELTSVTSTKSGESSVEIEKHKLEHYRLLVDFQEKKVECELMKDELRELSESKIGVENEVKEYKTMCDRLKEQIESLEEDKRSASEEKCADFSKEKCVELSKEIMDLENGKRRADQENDILKKRNLELEIQASETLNLGAELEDYKTKCHGLSTLLKVKEMGCVEFEGKLRGMEDKITGLGKIMSEREKTSQANLEELVKVLECGKRRAEDEINILKKKCMELEVQASEMPSHGAELEDYKTKCHGLSTALKVKEMECAEYEGKMKNLMSTKVSLDHELENYKTLGKTMSEREKTAHERIAYLEELVKKMKTEENSMLVQLKNENMVLECGKRSAEDEIEYWKKRFSELKMGLGGLQKVVGYDDICKKYMEDDICKKTVGRVNDANVAHLKVLSPAFQPCSKFSSFRGKLEDVNSPDTPDIKNQSDHSPNAKVEKKNMCSDTKAELVNEAAKQQLGSDTGGSCKENQFLLKQGSVTTSSTCIIDIDSEDEVIEVGDY